MTLYRQPNFPSVFTENSQILRPFDKALGASLADWSFNLKTILDGGLSFDDNMDISRVSVASHATPGTEFSVAHGLGKIPTGYIIYGQGAAGSLFDGVTANTKTTAYFKSDVSAVTFRVMFF